MKLEMLGFLHLMYREDSFQHTWWTILGLKCMISKYNQTSYVINEIQHFYVSFPLYFLPTRLSFHLRCKEPFKSTPTETINNKNNNNYKALSRGTTHLCFHKCDKSNGATLFPANKSDQSRGLVNFLQKKKSTRASDLPQRYNIMFFMLSRHIYGKLSSGVTIAKEV